jgi:tripartite-type tricarboxylate transporter receptor subunit TctC
MGDNGMTGLFSRLAASSVAAVLLTLAATPVSAEYPDRPIRIVLGFPAGGGADIMVRWYSEKLKEVSGATVILENKPGASGNIAADTVAKAKPDGYTLLASASAGMGAGRFLYKNLPYDSVTSFTPITTIAQLGFVLSVNPKNPVKNVSELTAALKAKQGKATYGWAVTSALASAVLYTSSENIPITPVNYKVTGNAVSDVAAGETDFTFSDMVFTIGQERQGKVKILAVTSEQRSNGAPHIPTMAESGVPAATTAPWWGFWAPAGTPPEVIAKLEKWINQIVEMPATKEFLVSQGADPLPGSHATMGPKLLQAIESWRKVTSIAKIEPQ